MKGRIIIILIAFTIFNNLYAQRLHKKVLETKKLVSIDMAEGWYEHYYHDQLNFSPIGFKKSFQSKKNSAVNYFTVFIKESKLSIYDFIKNKNKSRADLYQKIQVDVEKKQTKNGICYIEHSLMKGYSNTYQWLVYYYKYNGKIFATGYCVEQKYYVKYLNDALQMMDSFQIIKN